MLLFFADVFLCCDCLNIVKLFHVRCEFSCLSRFLIVFFVFLMFQHVFDLCDVLDVFVVISNGFAHGKSLRHFWAQARSKAQGDGLR